MTRFYQMKPQFALYYFLQWQEERWKKRSTVMTKEELARIFVHPKDDAVLSDFIHDFHRYLRHVSDLEEDIAVRIVYVITRSFYNTALLRFVEEGKKLDPKELRSALYDVLAKLRYASPHAAMAQQHPIVHITVYVWIQRITLWLMERGVRPIWASPYAIRNRRLR